MVKYQNLTYAVPVDGEAFGKDRMKGVIETSELVSRLNFDSAGDVKKYAKLMLGDEMALADAPKDGVDNSRNYVLGRHSEYQMAHAGKMADSLEEQVAMANLVFNPELKSHRGSDDGYNTLVNKIDALRKDVEAVSAKPKTEEEAKAQREKIEKIVRDELAPLNKYSQEWFQNLLGGQGIVNSYLQKEQKTVVEAVKSYGVRKYVDARVGAMKDVAEKSKDEEKKLGDEIREVMKKKTEEINAGKPRNAWVELNDFQRGEIMDKFAEKRKSLGEKYGNVPKEIGQYVGMITQIWYQTNFPKKDEDGENEDE